MYFIKIYSSGTIKYSGMITFSSVTPDILRHVGFKINDLY
jgi:hypothetical protein